MARTGVDDDDNMSIDSDADLRGLQRTGITTADLDALAARTLARWTIRTKNRSLAVHEEHTIEGTRIREVGPNVAIPAGAQVIDLSQATVMPGLVEAHNHLALTCKPVPENNVYYYTYVQESTALRAIQAASNGLQMLNAGFTIVRDMGNNGNYADTALRQAIDQGWIPGPTILNSGIIIGGMGGQFFPTPEMAKDHNIVYPEYLDADTQDEMVKAIRQNVLFGAKVIKMARGTRSPPASGRLRIPLASTTRCTS